MKDGTYLLIAIACEIGIHHRCEKAHDMNGKSTLHGDVCKLNEIAIAKEKFSVLIGMGASFVAVVGTSSVGSGVVPVSCNCRCVRYVRW